MMKYFSIFCLVVYSISAVISVLMLKMCELNIQKGISDSRCYSIFRISSFLGTCAIFFLLILVILAIIVQIFS